MAEETSLSHPSRYVKLTRDQDAPAEDIRPGELNQPVHVPQLEGRRCSECGQVLPESYEPPSDEPWTTGIFGCTDDPESCRTGLFCPCVLFGRNVEALREDIPWTTPCVCHAVFVEGGIALAILTAIFHGVDPRTSFLIGEGLVFSCGCVVPILAFFIKNCRENIISRTLHATLAWSIAACTGVQTVRSIGKGRAALQTAVSCL